MLELTCYLLNDFELSFVCVYILGFCFYHTVEDMENSTEVTHSLVRFTNTGCFLPTMCPVLPQMLRTKRWTKQKVFISSSVEGETILRKRQATEDMIYRLMGHGKSEARKGVLGRRRAGRSGWPLWCAPIKHTVEGSKRTRLPQWSSKCTGLKVDEFEEARRSLFLEQSGQGDGDRRKAQRGNLELNHRRSFSQFGLL